MLHVRLWASHFTALALVFLFHKEDQYSCLNPMDEGLAGYIQSKGLQSRTLLSDRAHTHVSRPSMS